MRGRVRARARRRLVALPAVAACLLASGACIVVGVPPAGLEPRPEPGGTAVPDHPAEPAPPAEPEPRTTPTPAGGTASSVDTAVPRRFHEVRALWVIRSSLTSPERIRAMVDEAHRGGFNTLLVQVRGRGDAYYVGGFEPRAEALADQPPDFDPLATVLREANARGLAVHAWLNTYLIAGVGPLPPAGDHLVRARPDLLAVPRALARELHPMDPYDRRYVERLHDWAGANTDRVEGLYAGPAHPEVRAGVRNVWLDLAERYPLDGLHFDYIRYPGPDWDYSRASLEAFRTWAQPRVGGTRAASLDQEARRDVLAWPEGEPALWDAFRREQVTALVARVARDVKRIRPDVVVSAAVFADPTDARDARYQDWPAWIADGLVDVVAPMAYSPDDTRFRRHVAAAVEAAGDPRRVWAGIGTWLTGYDGTIRKIGLAREAGAGGVALFSYDWAVEQPGPHRALSFLEGVGREAWGLERGVAGSR